MPKNSIVGPEVDPKRIGPPPPFVAGHLTGGVQYDVSERLRGERLGQKNHQKEASKKQA